MGFGQHILTPLLSSLTRKAIAKWGRVVDRESYIYTDHPPAYNPDPIDEESLGDRYFRVANNPHVKAGLIYTDASRLFVTARGLDPDDSGAFHPAQLIYTTPELANQEQWESLAFQYDERFEGGFQPILKSLQDPAEVYGRSIGEISWIKEDGKVFADFIWSRDPQEFIFSPPDKRPGLYRKKHIYSTSYSHDLKRMPDGKFLYMPYNPLFNNPYGQSLLRPLVKLVETWQGIGTGINNDPSQKGVFDAWREGLKKAGFGIVIGKYGNRLAGDSQEATQGLAKFVESLKKLSVSVTGAFHKEEEILFEKLAMESEVFQDFYTMYVQTVSTLMTGSATALTEGKFGSYAKEESTTVRQKSEREQINALMLSSVFTYQFNHFFLHYNFGDAVEAVPQLQLIPPNRIMPTTPEKQETQDEDEKEEAQSVITQDEIQGEDTENEE